LLFSFFQEFGKGLQKFVDNAKKTYESGGEEFQTFSSDASSGLQMVREHA
jgi:hypothetical protein